MYTANSNYILYVYKYLYGLYQAPQNIQSAQLAHRKSHVYPRLLQHIIFDKNWKRKKKSSNSNQINKCFFFLFLFFFFRRHLFSFRGAHPGRVNCCCCLWVYSSLFRFRREMKNVMAGQKGWKKRGRDESLKRKKLWKRRPDGRVKEKEKEKEKKKSERKESRDVYRRAEGEQSRWGEVNT
jgi:hypothetical protein